MALVVATVVVGFATGFVVFLDSRADAPSSDALLFTALFMALLAYGYAVYWAFDPKRAVRSATRRNAAYPTSAPGGYRVEDRDDRS